MTLSISDLFTPALSGVGTDGGLTPAPGTWLATLLANANTLQLATTSWQAGAPERTILAIAAASLSQEDGLVSVLAQAGFLDYAATGTVTFTAGNGEQVTAYVTPDPSIPEQNATGAFGWLDVLASSVYGVTRLPAQYAAGVLTIANTSGNTYSYAVGQYHVGNPGTGATYTNTVALSIPALGTALGGAIVSATNATPIVVTTTTGHGLSTGAVVYVAGVSGNDGSLGFFPVTVLSSTSVALNGSIGQGAGTGGAMYATTSIAIAADVAGTSGTAPVGAIVQAITANTGVVVTNLVQLIGATYESNVALAARCRLKLSSLSPNGPADAYRYFALTSAALLAAQTPPVSLSVGAITKAVTYGSVQLGTVTTVIASSQGAVPGVTNLGVIGATNASPIQITSASAHGLTDGSFVTVTGVVGNIAANGTFQITIVDGTNFTLNGSTGNGVYVSGGVIEGGDLGEVDRIIQANAVPDPVTAFTISAINFDLVIVASVAVPIQYAAAYLANVQTQLALYVAALPIGGIGASANAFGTIYYNDIIGILYAAGISSLGAQSIVQSILTLTLNGAATDLQYPSLVSAAVLLTTPNIQVVAA